MPRKTTPLGPVDSVSASQEPQPQLQVPPEGKRKVGRPSNAERAAREQAASQPTPPAITIKPAEMLGVTAIMLGLIAKGIKGDAPTPEEIAQVNDPLTAVANKYAIVSRWAPELALLGSLIVVSAAMRARAQERQEAEAAKVRAIRRTESESAT